MVSEKFTGCRLTDFTTDYTDFTEKTEGSYLNALAYPSPSTPFPVSPKGEKLGLLLPPWGKAGKGVEVRNDFTEKDTEGS
jgi:hypothetical protein